MSDTPRASCKGKNCGSTDYRFHSAECFDEHEAIANPRPETIVAPKRFERLSYTDSSQRVEVIKADDYDQLFTYYRTLKRRAQREGERVIAALAQRDKAIAFLQVYRNDTPLGNQPHMIAHEVDQFLKECGK
jgi:hypothetical protein